MTVRGHQPTAFKCSAMNESKSRTFRLRLLRPRFGLRTALVAVAIVSVALGLFSRRLQHARRQAVGRAEVERLGGVYYWDFEFDENSSGGKFYGVTGIRFHREPPDGWTERLLGMDFTHDVVAVYANGGGSRLGPAPTDDDIEQLVGLLPELREIEARSSAVTDAGLAQLARASKLERLDLFCTLTTDAGLAQLNSLPKLRDLNVADTLVTIAGVNRGLKNCPLEKLHLSLDQLKAQADYRELLRQRPELNVPN